MLLNGARHRAVPNYPYFSDCPECKRPLVAKCGSIVSWHWAHQSGRYCPSSGETEWHLAWKNQFPDDWIERPYGSRRADVFLPSGEVVEFQRKGLDPQTIAARERECQFRILWICNGTELGERFNLRGRETGIFSFRWKQPHKTWLAVSGRLLIDLGDDRLFHVMKCGQQTPLGGYGKLYSGSGFVDWVVQNEKIPPTFQRLQKFPIRLRGIDLHFPPDWGQT